MFWSLYRKSLSQDLQVWKKQTENPPNNQKTNQTKNHGIENQEFFEGGRNWFKKQD